MQISSIQDLNLFYSSQGTILRIFAVVVMAESSEEKMDLLSKTYALADS